MALQGSFSGKTANTHITPTIVWRAVQSVVGNYSDITATLSYRRDNDYVTGGKWTGTLVIGQQQFSGSKRFQITQDQDTVAITATARVQHDDTGALQVTVSATGAIEGSTLTGTDISKTITLDTIARASEISAADANVESCATVVISRKSSSFSHSIAYQFGQLSGYLDETGLPVAQEVRMQAETVNFYLPESFYGQIPDAPSGVCQLTCRTYDGDRQIGSDTSCNFTVTAAKALCSPMVSGMVKDNNPVTVALTGNEQVLVRFGSTARTEITAQAQNAAHLVSKSIGGVAVEGNVLLWGQPAKNSFVFSATDSRGYTAQATVTAPVIAYIPLTVQASVQRTAPTEETAVLTLEGNCWNGNFGTRENDLTVTVQVGSQTAQQVHVPIGEDHRYAATVQLSGLEYRQEHSVHITVADQVQTLEQRLTVHRGMPVFDWGESDFRFHVPVAVPALTVEGMSLQAYIRSCLEN